MKTEQEIRDARRQISEIVRANGGAALEQKAVLWGISSALQWVCDEERGPETVKQVLAGRPRKVPDHESGCSNYEPKRTSGRQNRRPITGEHMRTIEDLQAEIDGLKATLRVQNFKCESAQKYALDLEQQVAALRADAERYRWIRFEGACQPFQQSAPRVWKIISLPLPDADTFDAAIDAARAEMAIEPATDGN